MHGGLGGRQAQLVQPSANQSGARLRLIYHKQGPQAGSR